ncbi:MAG TPA: DMT family transporter [Deltaproteobacteria bacterium]|nr:DMT family transporter [Deltaproteobacteria bacterium]
MRRNHIVPLCALILAMILWAGSFIALKVAFAAYHPMVVIFGRMMTASLCFAFLAGIMKPSRPRTGDLPLLLFMLACEPCLYFLFEAAALSNTQASQAGVITALLPLMVALGAGVILRERVGVQTVVGFVISVAGAVVLSLGSGGDAMAPNPALGNFYEVCAMVCATGYTIALKRLTSRYSPLFLTALQACAGSVFYLPFLFLPTTAWPDRFDLQAVLSVVYLGVFVTMGAYGLYNYGVSRVKASQASAFVNLIPVLTVFFGWLFLGERLTAVQYAASLVVIAGVLLSQDIFSGWRDHLPGGAPDRVRADGRASRSAQPPVVKLYSKSPPSHSARDLP